VFADEVADELCDAISLARRGVRAGIQPLVPLEKLGMGIGQPAQVVLLDARPEVEEDG
jgi:hypothetical protein